MPGTAATSLPTLCPKCAIHQNSGKLTCCARGGSWHGMCGDTTNPKFDYTWAMGNKACKSKSPARPTQAPRETKAPDARPDAKSTTSAQPARPTQASHQTKAPDAKTTTTALPARPTQAPNDTESPYAKSTARAPPEQATQTRLDTQGDTTRNPSGKRDTSLYSNL